MNTVRSDLTILLILLCSFLGSIFSVEVYGQAGSRAPFVLDVSAFSGVENEVGGLSAQSGQGGQDQGALAGTFSPPPAYVPTGILRLPPEQKYLLWVELESGRMQLLEQQGNGSFIPRKVYPVSIGKNGYGKELEGDKRTPVGVYHFTSFIEDIDLIDFYGLGAYPMSYPSAYDLSRQRTGSGIWLHGLPKNVSQRPLLDSDGCVIIDNSSLLEMADYIEAGQTHVVLTEEDIQWQHQSVANTRSEQLENSFRQWLSAWEEIDHDSYLAFYSQEFTDFTFNKTQWSSYKRRINNQKSYINIVVDQLSFIAIPGESDKVDVRFYQDYQSSNYNWSGWKSQIWQETESGWEIVYEGNG